MQVGHGPVQTLCTKKIMTCHNSLPPSSQDPIPPSGAEIISISVAVCDVLLGVQLGVRHATYMMTSLSHTSSVHHEGTYRKGTSPRQSFNRPLWKLVEHRLLSFLPPLHLVHFSIFAFFA